MSNKKFFAFLSVALLALTFAAGPAGAAATPPAIADTYTLDDVTYYNVNSANFDSDKKFYEDVFNAKHSALGGRSLAQLWMMTAIGVKKDIVSKLTVSTTCDVAKVAKETVLKGQYGSGAVGSLLSNGYTYNYTAPTWNNSGYVETTLKIGALLGDVTFRVRFSDFGVGVILPGNANHYVSTSIENDTPKGEEASTTKNDSNNTVTIGQSLSKTITESIASTVDHSFSYSFTEGVKIGFETEASVGFAAFKISGESSFSATQTISDGWSKTDTQSKSKTVGSSISVTLPPYTTAMLKQGESDSTVTTNYNCPVFISYKVQIITEPFIPFLDQNYGFSRGAREDLKKRAITDVDYDPEGIDWRTILADSDVKDAVEKITTHAPMSPTGAKMVYKNRTAYNEVTGIVPLYPLNSVRWGDVNLSFIDIDKNANMHVGEYSYTKYLPVVGYNNRNAPYYGFDQALGHWIVVGEDGAEMSSATAPVVIENTSVAGYTKFRAVRPGHCYMKYVIDENAYPTSPGSKTYTKNSELSGTAMLDIHVEENMTYEIGGDYTGLVSADPESLDGDGKLEVNAYDGGGIGIDPSPYEWQKKEWKGITLTAGGMVSFTKPGSFHVRVHNTANGVYSEWKEIQAEYLGEDEFIEPKESINRTEAANGDTQLVVSGSFTGGVNADVESIEGEGKLQVETHSGTAKEEAVRYTWEKLDSDADGMNLAGDGQVSFTTPGIYHVRLKSVKEDGGALYSGWITIRANEKAPARLLRAPTANNYYNAATPELLNNDARYEGGVGMMYGLGADARTEPAEYGTEIPTATGAGTYYVWCRVQPDEDHDVSDPVCVTATMKAVEGDDSGEGGESGGNSSNSGSSSSSSGCDMGLGGLAVLALALPALMIRRKAR